jgi:hypothetical protein
MKRKIIALFIVIILSSFIIYGSTLAVDVSGAKYRTTINIKNNGATTAENVAVPVSLNVAGMIDGLQLNDDATDGAVLSATGANMPYMFGYGSAPSMLYVPTLPPYSSSNEYLYTKDVTGGKPVIFPDSYGLTVSDDSSIELGSDGGLFIKSLLLDSSSSGTWFSKGGDFYGNYGSGSITASAAVIGVGYPQVGATSTGNVPTGASFSVTYPSYSAGDLVIVIIVAINSTNHSNMSNSASFTEMWDTSEYFSGGYFNYAAYYKIMTGSEGSSGTWNCAISSSSTGSYRAYRITSGTYNGNPVAGSRVTGFSSNPNPPSLTSGFGAIKTLWIASTTASNVQTSPPANYTDLHSSNYLYVARRELIAATEDPGTFNVSATGWIANTIAIRGSGIVSVSSPFSEESDVYVSVNATSGDLELWLDGVKVDSESLAGIINNSASYQIGGGVLYFENAQIIKSGTVAASYAWEYPDDMNCIFANGTGTASGSPISLALGSNTITITGAGTFTIQNSFGWKAVATSGTATVSGSPKQCPSGQSRGNTTTTTITVSGTGNITVAVYRCLTDQTANTNDAIVGFRTTSSNPDVSANITGQECLIVNDNPPITESAGYRMIDDAEMALLTATPDYLYSEGGANFPGADKIDVKTKQADPNMPFEAVMYIIAYITSIMGGLIAMALTHKPERGIKGSLMIQGATSFLIMLFFVIAGGGIVAGFGLIIYAFEFAMGLIIKNPYNALN